MQRHKKKDTIGFIEISILLIIWLIVFVSPIVIQNNNNNVSWSIILTDWEQLLPFFILTLFNHFVLVPFFFFKKNITQYLLGAIFTLLLFVFFTTLLHDPIERPMQARSSEEFFMLNPPPGEFLPGEPRNINKNRGMVGPPPGSRNISAQQQLPGGMPPFLNVSIIALLILGFDTGLRTVFMWTKSEQENEVLEKEKVKSELAFLRNQVSPHFFMNTLNNIHALIDFDSEEAKEAVIRLSKLMRHLLYDSEKELITIKEELSFIESYVDLMKMRINDKVKVVLNINTFNSEKKIPPLLFTSLIENAFKYGVSYQNDSFIDIAISTTETELSFVLKNSIAENTQKQYESHSGIGLENTRKRLNLLYQDNYSMDICSEENIFSVNLKLPL
jgi:two-component sensor histidine kinase